MDEEHRRRLVEFANALALKNPQFPLLRRASPATQYSDLIEMVESQLSLSSDRRRLVLPNLTAFSNQSLGVFSDYSGEGSGRYFVYSVLVCGFNMRAAFHRLMGEARNCHQLGQKEIAFKDFRMGPLKRALPEFLHAADQLPGLLCAVVVDKQISSVFGANNREKQLEMVRWLEEAGLGHRKPAVTEKLLRITHLTAYLIALLGVNGQHVFWMTDHDEIAGSPEQHKILLELLFSRVLPLYTRPDVHFGNMGGAVPFSERSVEMNDLLSIPDVSAGTIGDYLSKRDIQVPEDIRVKEGAEKVLLWLARDGIGLKKACFVLRKNAEGLLERGTIEFSPKNTQEVVFIPIFG
jgi:hypothetical protein